MSRRAGGTVALSTGKVARYCMVTSNTILNWIKEKELPAYTTAGGQYRIVVRELREYMVRVGMSTELLDRDYPPSCREVRPDPRHCPTCAMGQEEPCYEEREGVAPPWRQEEHCAECAYYRRWGKGAPLSPLLPPEKG